MAKHNTVKTTRKQAHRRKRMREALDYRLAGNSYRDIAQEMRISVSTAHTYIQDALKEITREKAEEVLKMQLARYDQLLAAYYTPALENDYIAADKTLQILARIDRLNGIDQAASEDTAQAPQSMLVQLFNTVKQEQEENKN